jgi:tellurite resistance protein TehA-like permease
MSILIVLAFAVVAFILFIRWGSKSIPRAIVFVVVLPIFLVIAIVVLMAASAIDQRINDRPYHVTKANPL